MKMSRRKMLYFFSKDVNYQVCRSGDDRWVNLEWLTFEQQLHSVLKILKDHSTRKKLSSIILKIQTGRILSSMNSTYSIVNPFWSL